MYVCHPSEVIQRPLGRAKANPRLIFSGSKMPNRVSFLIDGFNVYHSIIATGQKNLKWLDYHSLCKSLITDVVALQGSTLEKVYYFTALAHHAGVDVVGRHCDFIKALESRNVQVVKGNFKRKNLKCKVCFQPFSSHEEKETDVNIAMRLLECFLSDECDTVVLVTGDTDLVTAITTSKRLFPKKRH